VSAVEKPAEAPRGLRPIADPKALRASTERLAATNAKLRARIMRGSSPSLPAQLTDAADDLERHVRELVGVMRPEVQARAAGKLLRIALELGVTLPVGGAR